MTYTYSCDCGLEYDVEQRITDSALELCPHCSKHKPKRLISGTPLFSLIPGPAGDWSCGGGYAKPENFRKAEAKLGHRVHRKL